MHCVNSVYTVYVSIAQAVRVCVCACAIDDVCRIGAQHNGRNMEGERYRGKGSWTYAPVHLRATLYMPTMALLLR